MQRRERRRREKRQAEIDYGKTLMVLSDFGTLRPFSGIFPSVSGSTYVNNWASMRNHSCFRPCLCRAILLPAAGLALLALSAIPLHAQCSEDDPDSFGCQMQQAAPQPSTTQSSGSPAVLTLQQQTQQGSLRSDRSNEASADNSLSSEPSYTEESLHNGQTPTGAQRQPLPPEPPSEFQRFVAATAGRMLPIFGAKLFANRPASFGPIDQAPAPQNMVVGTGDELRIRIWGQINFSANLRVSREGEIYLPKVGAVHVAGLEFSAVNGHLRQALDRVYRNFELSVDMGEIHSIQIYVSGLARQPGEYTVSALSTLVDAAFLSGGPARAGSLRHLELKREGKTIADFDLYALLVRGDKSGDVQLQSGDVLFIPPAGPQVALTGSVRQEAIYELRGEETIEGLLQDCGGKTAIASGGHIAVERIEDHTQLHAFTLKDDAVGLATMLADGDIVRIDPIVSSYRDTVTLRGSVANPGRFLWHRGMKLSDLMPERDALISRDYWWRRTQMGFPAPEFLPSLDGRQTQLQMQPDRFSGTSGSQANRDSNRQGNTLSNAQTNRFDGSTSNPQPSFSPNDPANAQQNPANARSSGAAGALGGAQASGRMSAETELLRPAAETDWNYAVIERLDPATMTTSLIPFDLGKLVLDHDAAQDLELQPGDIVTVFSQDDIPQPMERQTKYVRLEGEFVRPGVYSVLPGETLRSLVERAGGLTGKAYLYGSEFTRKSTQIIEQQRFKEYADRLEHQLARSSITQNSSSSQDSAQQSQSAAAFNRELIERLRQLEPSGRIVLSLKPHSSGAQELPETALEDGDQLMVPPIPATIQVVGAVLNQNAFLYRNGGRVSEYMRLAGGPNRDADRHQAFVLRADGSVTGRGSGQSVFASGFENSRLYPGDTIIVPEKSVGSGALHELLSWTQVFSQVALGAAAIDVIK
jgi:protein involved in polysaccharide export with SLBB domain